MTKKILILGGGFGGIYSLINLHKYFHKNKNIKITLVSNKNYFLFTPLLHEFVTGNVSLGNLIEPIRTIIKCCDYDFIHSKVELIDFENKLVKTSNLNLSYDYLIIALGSITNFYNIPGAEKYSFPLKNIEDAIKLKNRIIENFEKASLNINETKKLLTFVIVGGGATGIELAAEMAEYIYYTFSKIYSNQLAKLAEIYLIEKNNELIYQFHPKLRIKIKKILEKKGIKIKLGTGCKEITEDYLKLDNDEIIETKNVIWTAGIKPNLPEIIGKIEKDNQGRIIVDQFLRSKNYEEVFVIGDCCSFIQNEKILSQLAQVAVRQAESVSENLNYLLNNKPLKIFKYRHKGDLLSVGKLYAVGEIKNIIISGWWVWILWKLVYLSKIIFGEIK